MTLIPFTWSVDGVLTNADSVKFSDPTGTYGLRRTDTMEILIPDGTNLANTGPGTYEYNLVDPEPNLIYDYWIEVVYLASTYRFHYPGSQTGISLISVQQFAFTSREEIERVYSTVGVNLRVDDWPDTEQQQDVIDEIVNAATETVASYTLRYYNSDALYTSPWVRRRATIIACYYLSMRRANGTQFGMEYQRVIEDLEKFLGNKAPFIPGVPVRSAAIPTVSRYIIDDRNPTDKLRIVREYSTKPYAGQKPYSQFFRINPF